MASQSVMENGLCFHKANWIATTFKTVTDTMHSHRLAKGIGHVIKCLDSIDDILVFQCHAKDGKVDKRRKLFNKSKVNIFVICDKISIKHYAIRAKQQLGRSRISCISKHRAMFENTRNNNKNNEGNNIKFRHPAIVQPIRGPSWDYCSFIARLHKHKHPMSVDMNGSFMDKHTVILLLPLQTVSLLFPLPLSSIHQSHHHQFRHSPDSAKAKRRQR